MANNAGAGSFTLMDFSRETSSFGFATGAITAVSLPGTLTQFGALRAAVQGITNGAVVGEQLIVNRTKFPEPAPGSLDATAKREAKWLVTYTDTTEYFDPPTNAIPNAGYGKVFTVEIPCADDSIAGIKLPNSDEADLTSTEMAAFVTAFEDIARSPYNGAVTVTRVMIVGRNN